MSTQLWPIQQVLYNQLSHFPSSPWGTMMVQTRPSEGESHLQTTLMPSCMVGEVREMKQACHGKPQREGWRSPEKGRDNWGTEAFKDTSDFL